MSNQEWLEFIEHLVDAKRQLGRAWSVLDGTDGAAEETERAFSRATDAIDDVYKSEAASDWNADVASPPHVQDFWEKTGQLPGFAVGT
jgi:hypothetical protein